jgi:DNA modification methylase
MKIIYKNVEDLIPYVNNTRTHSKEQVNQIASSIKEFGFTNPVLIDEQGGIIAGHGRIMGAKLLKMDEVPTICLDGLSEAQKKAYIIADNKLALNAGWDEELLKLELQGLKDMDFDLSLVGFSDEELAEFDIEDDLIVLDTDKSDDVPEVEENPIIKLGDLIELGHNYQHRLLCGDSTKEDDIKQVLQEDKADLVLTDPPYLIQTEGGCKGSIGQGLRKQGKDIEFIADFNPINFLKVLPMVIANKKMNAYVFCNKELLPDYLVWARDNGYSFNVLVWKKPNAIPIGDSHRPDIEYLLLFRKSAIWNNGIKGVNYSRVIEASRETGLHPTMKPIEILENEMQISSNKSSIVFDFFGGSGSTMIACENLQRKCRMIELSEQYAQVIVQRYVDYTSNPKIKINGVEVDWEDYKASAKND